MLNPEFESVKKVLTEATVLPRETYISEKWYQSELENIFGKSWIWAGTTAQVKNIGDFFTMKIANDPLLIVRSSENKIEGLINVCRHRGTLVAQATEGNSKSFACPYHGWTYGLDGSLRGCPGLSWKDMEGVAGFDPNTFGLHHVKVDVWQGLVFVNLNPNAESLESYLAGYPEILSRIDLESLVTAKQYDCRVEVNWKIFADNMAEQYHVPYLHRETLYRTFDYDIRTNRNWLGWYSSKKDDLDYRTTDQPGVPKINGMNKDDLEHVWFFFLYPSTYFILTPNQLVVYNSLPDGLFACKSHQDYRFVDRPRDNVEFKEASFKYVQRLLFDEDIPAQLSVQEGLLSTRGLRPGDGRISVRWESGLYHLHNWILDRVAPSTRDS
jgi:choline monooxygenase